MLTSQQREGLNRALVEYLVEQSVPQSAIDDVATKLGVSLADPATGLGLEAKWTAVIRLQRKILDLEAHVAALEQDRTLPPSSAIAAADWLPRQPPSIEFKGHRSHVTAVAFHPVWPTVVSASDDGTINVWDTQTGELERTIRAHTRAVTGLDFAASSGRFASSSGDLSIKVWDPANDYANIRTLIGHEHTVSAVRFVPPQDSLLLSASRDKTVRVWQVDSGYCLRVIKGHSDWVRTLAPTFDGQLLVSAGSDRQARIVTIDGGETRAVAVGHEHVIECVAIAPPAAAKTIGKLQGLDYSSEDTTLRYFATGSRDKNIIIWDSRGERVANLNGHDNWVRGLVFHPNGKHLISVSDDKTLRVWDLETSKLVKSIVAHSHFVTCIAWGGAKSIATGSIDTLVKLWK